MTTPKEPAGPAENWWPTASSSVSEVPPSSTPAMNEAPSTTPSFAAPIESPTYVSVPSSTTAPSGGGGGGGGRRVSWGGGLEVAPPSLPVPTSGPLGAVVVPCCVVDMKVRMAFKPMVFLCTTHADAGTPDYVLSWTALSGDTKQDGYVLLSCIESAKAVSSGIVLRFAKSRLREVAHSSGGLLQLEMYRPQGESEADSASSWSNLVTVLMDVVEHRP